MKAFFQLYLANVKEFVRDRMAMFWTLAFPVFFIVRLCENSPGWGRCPGKQQFWNQNGA